MKKLVALLTFLLLASTGGFSEEAKEVTLEGAVVCAKCTLHVEGLTDCQNALVVEDEENGEERQYYLTMNAVNEEFGDVCMGRRPVRITGTLSEQDGQTWIAASQIEAIDLDN